MEQMIPYFFRALEIGLVVFMFSKLEQDYRRVKGGPERPKEEQTWIPKGTGSGRVGTTRAFVEADDGGPQNEGVKQ